MDTLGTALLTHARNAIRAEFGLTVETPPPHPALDVPGACFVTLRLNDRLRGCIGSLEAYRPLAQDIYANARAAAFHDPRFSPLQRAEIDAVAIEVSLLSTASPIDFKDEADALQQLHPHQDGVILEYGRQRATFLPQVWEELPDTHSFMAQLKLKAGLGGDFWSPAIRLSRYEVRKWKENAKA